MNWNLLQFQFKTMLRNTTAVVFVKMIGPYKNRRNPDERQYLVIPPKIEVIKGATIVFRYFRQRHFAMEITQLVSV